MIYWLAMHEELLNEIERILERSDEVIVPVKKLWNMLQCEDEFQEISVPSFGEFTDMLRSDERFEFMHPIDYSGLYANLSGEEREQCEIELEETGFYSGDRIKLKRIPLTGELLATMIERSCERMMDALAHAWKEKAKDEEAEKRILAIMEKAQQLQKDIQRIVTQIRKTEGRARQED
jgi:hypothetical protein